MTGAQERVLEQVQERASPEPDDAATRRLLTDIFEELLDQGCVDPDDSFFDLGGSSMLAISLILEIERMTGYQLPVTAIYDAPSVNAMTALLADQGSPSFSPLISLREGDTSACLFLVHGLGGSAIELRQLARQIDRAFSVYGIQAFGLCNATPHGSVEAMASAYTDEILRVQPSGPYSLAGYSFGGLVAFEIARQLKARGLEVRFLGLIDSYPDDGITLGRLWSRLGRVIQAPADERRTLLGNIRQNLALRLRTRRGDAVTPRELGDARLPRAIAEVNLMNKVAMHKYRPSVLAGDVVFFQASLASRTLPGDPLPIWRPFARMLTIERITGDHLSMIRADVGLLAAAFNRHLEVAAAAA